MELQVRILLDVDTGCLPARVGRHRCRYCSSLRRSCGFDVAIRRSPYAARWPIQVSARVRRRPNCGLATARCRAMRLWPTSLPRGYEEAAYEDDCSDGR